MAFSVSADAYDRFMGRYSTLLSPPFADFAGVGDGMRVLDVGCGSGVLTAVLVARVGTERVAAIDPSAQFVEAMHERFPGLDVRTGAAEHLPYADGAFDASLAQLVVHFMGDPVGGIREMARVTAPGGPVAASVWDLAGGRAPISPFWQAAREIDPSAPAESDRPGTSREDLAELFRQAGLDDAVTTELEITAHHASFEEWWEPFGLGVGPVSVYLAKLGPERQAAIRERCRELLPAGPHTVRWYAWAARGTAG